MIACDLNCLHELQEYEPKHGPEIFNGHEVDDATAALFENTIGLQICREYFPTNDNSAKKHNTDSQECTGATIAFDRRTRTRHLVCPLAKAAFHLPSKE